LGDDLLESFPCYIITERLEKKLLGTDATGYELGDAEVTKSEFFKDMYPKAPPLPKFFWLKIIGEPGVDDFGYSNDYRLVVSEAVLRMLQSLNLKHCEIQEFP